MGAGTLYGVSMGPGDPELVTVRAARVLERVDCVAAPAVGSSARTALGIVQHIVADKPVIDCPTPMTRDRAATDRAYDEIADALAAHLDAGEDVAFVTLGDASVYSTWSYVCQRMTERGYDVQTIPGVTSFCAAAARLNQALCERDEQLLVVPASYDAPAAARAAAALPGTTVFMKAGKHLNELHAELSAAGLAATSSLVANCNLPGETVISPLTSSVSLPNYLSLVITKSPQPDHALSASAKNLAVGAHLDASADNGIPLMRSRPLEQSPEALSSLNARIPAPNLNAVAEAQRRWDAVAKPLGGLGMLEDAIVDIAALTGSADVDLSRRAVVVMCADNGVVAQGVSQCGPEVTRAVAEALVAGTSSVCVMARTCNADVVPVDIGMQDTALIPSPEYEMAMTAGLPLLADTEGVPGIVNRRVSFSTGDISYGPALSRDQALRAIHVGIDLASELCSQGYRVLAAGEMGIGNTTTAAAMTAAFFGLTPQQVAGRGAGLSDQGLHRKRQAIERALRMNAPDPDDALDVLAKVGGLDIAGLAGLFIGGALNRVPVIVDGFISAVAAYTAVRLCPCCAPALVGSHISTEPAARLVVDALGLRAPLQAGMHLGEGTGAVCLLPLLDAALALYQGATFQDEGIQPYRHLQGEDR